MNGPKKTRSILIHTTRNEIIFGFTSGALGDVSMSLARARMVVRYSGTHKGVLGLCVVGPDRECKISDEVEEIFIRDIVWACWVSDVAAQAFQVPRWS